MAQQWLEASTPLPPYPHNLPPQTLNCGVSSKSLHFSLEFVIQAQVTENRCAGVHVELLVMGGGEQNVPFANLCAFVVCAVFPSQQSRLTFWPDAFLFFLGGIAD